MAITLGTPSASGPKLPSVKFDSIGDTVVGRVIDASFDMPRNDMETGQPQTNAKGNPKTQHLLVLHVMDGTTARIVDGDGNGVDPTDPQCLLWVGGADKYTNDNPLCFSDVHKAHGPLNVGDVVRVRFASTKPSGKPQPRKVKEFAIRHPKPEEAEAVAAAEAAHQARKAPVALECPDGTGASLSRPTTADDF